MTDLLRFACWQNLCQEAYQQGKGLETDHPAEDSAACQEGVEVFGFRGNKLKVMLNTRTINFSCFNFKFACRRTFSWETGLGARWGVIRIQGPFLEPQAARWSRCTTPPSATALSRWPPTSGKRGPGKWLCEGTRICRKTCPRCDGQCSTCQRQTLNNWTMKVNVKVIEKDATAVTFKVVTGHL